MIDVEQYMNKFIQNRLRCGAVSRVKYKDGVVYYEEEETSDMGALFNIYDTLTGKTLKWKKVEDIEQY